MADTATFAPRLLRWFDVNGRHDLPWQLERTPYTVWLSEVMLQQTQAATVAPYFQRFIATFPTLRSLAEANDDTVMAHWSGLGYYSRARNLHKAAKQCVELHGGEIPADFESLHALPGVGRSTAGAIMAQAFGKPFAILDGNVKRVLARYLGVREWTGSSSAQRVMWEFAERAVPNDRVADYTQAQMDLGSLVCKPRNPLCGQCPLSSDCFALTHDLIDKIPARKPRKARPERSAYAAVLMRDDAVLLTKRPPSGIWSSLWTLPQADDLDALHALLETTVQLPAQARHLATIDHAFSHYDLHLTPVHFGQVALRDHIADHSSMQWVRRDMLNQLGIPAPIRTLLAEHILRNDP